MKKINFLLVCSLISIVNAVNFAKRNTGLSKNFKNIDSIVLPKDLYKTHPKCNDKQHSPIDIYTLHSVYDKKLAPITILNDIYDDEKWIVSNNGHTGNVYVLFW